METRPETEITLRGGAIVFPVEYTALPEDSKKVVSDIIAEFIKKFEDLSKDQDRPYGDLDVRSRLNSVQDSLVELAKALEMLISKQQVKNLEFMKYANKILNSIKTAAKAGERFCVSGTHVCDHLKYIGALLNILYQGVGQYVIRDEKIWQSLLEKTNLENEINSIVSARTSGLKLIELTESLQQIDVLNRDDAISKISSFNQQFIQFRDTLRQILHTKLTWEDRDHLNVAILRIDIQPTLERFIEVKPALNVSDMKDIVAKISRYIFSVINRFQERSDLALFNEDELSRLLVNLNYEEEKRKSPKQVYENIQVVEKFLEEKRLLKEKSFRIFVDADSSVSKFSILVEYEEERRNKIEFLKKFHVYDQTVQDLIGINEEINEMTTAFSPIIEAIDAVKAPYRYINDECIYSIRDDLKPLRELCLECYSKLDKSVQLDELAGLDKSARLGELDELDWISKIVYNIMRQFQSKDFQFDDKFEEAKKAVSRCHDKKQLSTSLGCAIDDIDLIIEKNARQKEK